MRQPSVAPLAVVATIFNLLPSGDVLVRVQAGDITSKINGKWQEFENGGAVPQYVKACLFGCSSFSSSEPLGTNEGPWTYTYSSGCTMLTVLEGRGTGTTIFEVEDNGVSLGNTTMGVRLDDCQDDPDYCYKDQYAGKRSFLMLPGSHSFHIKQVYEVTPVDGGWFKINTTACPTPTISPRPTTKIPTKPPATIKKPTTKTPTKPTTKPPTKAPQTGPTPSKAPTKSPTKAPQIGTTPSKPPTKSPTKAPQIGTTPSKPPTKSPTKAPQIGTTPSKPPTQATTNTPTKAPSQATTKSPSKAPTTTTTKGPTKAPQSGNPPTSTRVPTKAPQGAPVPAISTTTGAPSTPTIPNVPPTAPGPTPTKPNKQCWTAPKCAKRLTTSLRCPCDRFRRGDKRCLRRQSFKLCCPSPKLRPGGYAPAVVRAAANLCRRQNNYLVLP